MLSVTPDDLAAGLDSARIAHAFLDLHLSTADPAAAEVQIR